MTNSENGESIFKYLPERISGDTCTPWKSEDDIPYDLKNRDRQIFIRAIG